MGRVPRASTVTRTWRRTALSSWEGNDDYPTQDRVYEEHDDQVVWIFGFTRSSSAAR